MISVIARKVGLLALVGATTLMVSHGAAIDGSLVGCERTQVISLSAGWNAVYLEVEPVEASPSEVFKGLPIDRVATLFQTPTSNQFVTDPSVDLFKGSGWGVWYAPDLPEAFLKSLDSIEGNRAYLVHAKTACQWNPKGTVKFSTVRWLPDAYNFVGFSVESPGAPTFQQFFAGSTAHHDQTIYRLVNGRWKKVLQPGAESMRSGEAFWIYSKGASTYQGPISVETTTRKGLLLGSGAGSLVLRNACSHPVSATLTHQVGSGPSVPLSILVKSFGDPSVPIRSVPTAMPSGEWTQSLPPLEAEASLSVPFESRGGEMSQSRQDSLLKITSDMGTVTWVPVAAFRDDLAE